MSRPVMWDRWYDTRYVRHVSVWACEQAKWTLVFLSMCCQRERWMFYCIFIHGTLIFFEIWGNCPCHFAHVMHLSMSCPNGGSAGIYELLTRRRCPCQGKFDFFLTRASPRVGIIDILDQGGLTSHRALPKDKGKQKNWTTTYINNWNITVLCLLKLKMIFKRKWYLFKFICLLQFPLPLIIQSDLY